jgi:hypothetical protein
MAGVEQEHVDYDGDESSSRLDGSGLPYSDRDEEVSQPSEVSEGDDLMYFKYYQKFLDNYKFFKINASDFIQSKTEYMSSSQRVKQIQADGEGSDDDDDGLVFEEAQKLLKDSKDRYKNNVKQIIKYKNIAMKHLIPAKTENLDEERLEKMNRAVTKMEKIGDAIVRDTPEILVKIGPISDSESEEEEFSDLPSISADASHFIDSESEEDLSMPTEISKLEHSMDSDYDEEKSFGEVIVEIRQMHKRLERNHKRLQNQKEILREIRKEIEEAQEDDKPTSKLERRLERNNERLDEIKDKCDTIREKLFLKIALADSLAEKDNQKDAVAKFLGIISQYHADVELFPKLPPTPKKTKAKQLTIQPPKRNSQSSS